MNVPPARSPARTFAAVASAICALAFAATPRPARALTLLDDELTLGARGSPAVFTVALAAAPATDPSLDFDLLGKPPPVAAVDDPAMGRRRWMLKTHQAVGLGLVALQIATTVVGQLNYSDKYGGSAPLTGKYELSHTALAYTNVAVFAANGGIALFAPSPKNKPKRGFDRMSLHKLSMAIAAGGMLAQAGLGIYTDSREGYLNQQDYAKAHLAIGYATLAALGVGVGALVF